MKIWVLVVVGALLVGAVPTAAILLTHDDASATRADHAHHGRAWTHGPQGPAFGRHRHQPGMTGPGRQHLRRWQQQWQQQWRSLTPEQRARKMSELARQHAAALDKWARCLQQKHDPQSCPRPVPPGIAKKLSPQPPQG